MCVFMCVCMRACVRACGSDIITTEAASQDMSAVASELYLINALEGWRKVLCRRNEPLDKFHLVGHSFGAYVAGSWALRCPARVSKIVLVEPWGLGE